MRKFFEFSTKKCRLSTFMHFYYKKLLVARNRHWGAYSTPWGDEDVKCRGV